MINFPGILADKSRADPLKASSFGRLFISNKCRKAFEAKTSKIDNPNSDNEWRTFTVDNDFQYGQADSKGTHRFLVLHDKEQKPYQVSLCPHMSRIRNLTLLM
jgi:hypothetical protein